MPVTPRAKTTEAGKIGEKPHCALRRTAVLAHVDIELDCALWQDPGSLVDSPQAPGGWGHDNPASAARLELAHDIDHSREVGVEALVIDGQIEVCDVDLWYPAPKLFQVLKTFCNQPKGAHGLGKRAGRLK